MLRREAVIHEDHGHAGAVSDLADKPLMRIEAAEDPAATVEIHHRRQALLDPAWTDDVDVGPASGSDGKRALLDIGRRPLVRAGLRIAQDLARRFGRQRIDRRAAGGSQGVDESLRGRLQRGLGCARIGRGRIQPRDGSHCADRRHVGLLS
jgi:hypothetical protein